MRTRPYEEFFDACTAGSLRSARLVVPLLVDLLGAKSVVDFGCGRGAWLHAFQEAGVEDVLGFDGPYVDEDRLLIGHDRFRSADLSRPVVLERRFDLAICLEVAEHLRARSARTLVDSLASAAPIVLFSAAIPGQGGVSHVNEQWPEYWEGIFAGRGFRRLDVIRPMIWQNAEIESWYRQNVFVYVNPMEVPATLYDSLRELPSFAPEFDLISTWVIGQYKYGRGLLGQLRGAWMRSIKKIKTG